LRIDPISIFLESEIEVENRDFFSSEKRQRRAPGEGRLLLIRSFIGASAMHTSSTIEPVATTKGR
jgi:hypothetical protein